MLRFMALSTFVWVLISCLVLQYQVKCEDFLKELLSPRISCPKGSVAYGSHCYALFLSEKSWMEADACQKWSQGRLVSVLTGSEAYFVFSMIQNTGTKSENIWGLDSMSPQRAVNLMELSNNDVLNYVAWELSNNDVLNYVAWEKDTPSCPHSGYCGSLSESSNYEKWQDFDCKEELPYICKFKE